MRNFSARETEWLEELDGIELATFWRRAFAFAIDWVIVVILVSAFATISASVFGYLHRNGTPTEDTAHIFSGPEHGRKLGIVLPGGPKVNVYRVDEHTPIGETIKLVVDVLVPVLYFGILLWRGKGRTPGKRLMRVRVVSIVHQHLSSGIQWSVRWAMVPPHSKAALASSSSSSIHTGAVLRTGSQKRLW